MRQKYDSELKARQVKSWRDSHRSKKINVLGLSLPSNKFLELPSKFGRQQASLLIQLRTGHAPLNVYLHRIGKLVRPSCPACGAQEETVKHFVLDCPGHAHKRWYLKKAADAHKMGLLKFALSTEDGVKEIMEFINGTERFCSRTAITLSQSTAIQQE